MKILDDLVKRALESNKSAIEQFEQMSEDERRAFRRQSLFRFIVLHVMFLGFLIALASFPLYCSLFILALIIYGLLVLGETAKVLARNLSNQRGFA
jgi:hypothetical protein